MFIFATIRHEQLWGKSKIVHMCTAIEYLPVILQIHR